MRASFAEFSKGLLIGFDLDIHLEHSSEDNREKCEHHIEKSNWPGEPEGLPWA